LVASQTATFSTIKSAETGRASSLFNTNRQVAASVGVAVLTTVLLEQTAARIKVTGVAATAQAQLFGFHDAFAASIVFGLVGILFALGIHDQDAAASMQLNSQATKPKDLDPLGPLPDPLTVVTSRH
jgi:hypothetical protein